MEVLVTQIGAIAVALIAAYQAIRLERLRKETRKKDVQIKEAAKNFSALSLLVDFELISTVSGRVDDVFRNTGIDRFLLIIAVNGRDVFNVVSVVYERHKQDDGGKRVDINATGRYNHVRIDSNYKDMLKEVESRGKMLLETEHLPADSMLSNIYLNEGVTASVVYPVTRMKIDDKNDMLLFCSYATHNEQGITKKDGLFISTMHGGIQSAFGKYIEKIDGYAAQLEDEDE